MQHTHIHIYIHNLMNIPNLKDQEPGKTHGKNSVHNKNQQIIVTKISIHSNPK